MKDFEDMVAWQESLKLAKDIYKISAQFPESEKFGLTSQMRRATISISSNLAEGFGRRSLKDKSHFYTVALGSLLEVKSQLYVAIELGSIDKKDIASTFTRATSVHKLINALIKSLRGKS